jgi:hypothetical protein
MLNNPLERLASAITAIDIFTPNKNANPVFVGGVKYPSLFNAGLDSGINSVSMWKAIKRRGGGPAQVRKTLIVLESWVIARTETIRGNYQL